MTESTPTELSRSKTLPFFKVSGAGNDFIALVEPEEMPNPRAIRRLCERRRSLGADGLFAITRKASVGASGSTRVQLSYFNADGSEAELCGNASRCAARLAFALGWAGDEVELLTASGTLRARKVPDGKIRVEMPAAPERPVALQLESHSALEPEGSQGVWSLVVGVPHVVVALDPARWPDLEAFPLAAYGPRLRAHSSQPRGANANFLLPGAEPDGVFSLRTFERGVEAETLACGSGAVASAIVATRFLGYSFPVALRVRSGDLLLVDSQQDGAGSPTIWLEGPAQLVARGELFV